MFIITFNSAYTLILGNMPNETYCVRIQALNMTATSSNEAAMESNFGHAGLKNPGLMKYGNHQYRVGLKNFHLICKMQ